MLSGIPAIEAATRVKPGTTPSGAVLIGDRLSRSELLLGFDDEQREAFMKLATIIELDEPGAHIVREGDPAENFYFILEGEAEVIKRELKGKRELKRILTTLGPGDHFGESSLLREGSRSASVVARTPLVLVMIRARMVRDEPHKHSWLAPLLLGLDRMTHRAFDDLRSELDEVQVRESLGNVLLLTIFALSLYALGLALTYELFGEGMVRTTATRVLDLALAGAAIAAVRVGPTRDWGFFGLRRAENWLRAFAELSVTTLGCLVLLSVLASVLRLHASPAQALFELPPDLFVEVIYLFGVSVIVGIEELVVRGVMQTSLDTVLRNHPWRTLLAVGLSNALFAAVHTPISASWALLQFALGLAWGMVYARQRSLLGVTISHVIVVYVALRVLHLDILLAGV